MKDTLAEINELRRAGLIGQCAIGGAMGATFYLEPVSTFDLDRNDFNKPTAEAVERGVERELHL